MNKTPVILLISLFAGLQACSNRSGALSDKKMEDVLFDIHIADAEIETDSRLFSQYQYRTTRKKQLYDAVFEKHGITLQTFDTSLVWYSSRLEQFNKIYERINERYTLLEEQFKEEKTRANEALRSGIYAVNRWKGAHSALLDIYSAQSNRFSLQVDSLKPLKGTVCELQFAVLGLTPKTKAKAMLCIHVKDTVLIRNQAIESNGNHWITVNTDSISRKEIESVWGLIQLEAGENAMVIHNIQVRITSN